MLKLSILHTDGKIADIDTFKEKDLDELLRCIYKNKMYWNQATERGIWINPLTVRHIIAERIGEDPDPLGLHNPPNTGDSLSN